MVTDLLRAELRAMNVIPSLPATEVARTRWSPELAGAARQSVVSRMTVCATSSST